jgi:hypothetical protein
LPSIQETVQLSQEVSASKPSQNAAFEATQEVEQTGVDAVFQTNAVAQNGADAVSLGADLYNKGYLSIKIYKAAKPEKRFSQFICFVNVKEFAKTLTRPSVLLNTHVIDQWEDLIW